MGKIGAEFVVIANTLNLDRSKGIVQKTFQDWPRFYSEVHYNRFFARSGIRVPSLLETDTMSRTVWMEYVSGRHPHPKSEMETMRILGELGRWQKNMIIRTDKFQMNREFKKINHDVENVFTRMKCEYDKQMLASYLTLFQKLHSPALFKDTQWSNWLLNAKKDIIAIDFDYVRVSHFIFNLSQFLRDRYEIVDLDACLKVFLRAWDRRDISVRETFTLLKFALFYSEAKAFLYSFQKKGVQRAEVYVSQLKKNAKYCGIV